MEEDIPSLLEALHPGDSQNYGEQLANLSLTWKYLESLPPNARQVRIFYRKMALRDLETPKGSLCLIHGFGEHSGRFMNVAVEFALEGFEVHLGDLRHLGCSGGARAGHDLLELQKDVNLILQQAREDLPCFIWGHSMGGLLVTTVLINNPSLKVKAIITAPLYRNPALKVNWFKIQALEFLQPLLEMQVMNSYICPSSITRDDSYLKQMFEDRKMLPFLGPKMGLSMLHHMKHLWQAVRLFKHPVVFFHGKADSLTCHKATVEVYQRCTSQDKTLKILEGVYHEPHHDYGREEFFSTVKNWMETRLQGSLGKVGSLKVGYPGLPKPSKAKYLVLALLLVYFVVAYKVRITNHEKIWKSLSKLALKLGWPTYYLLKVLV